MVFGLGKLFGKKNTDELNDMSPDEKKRFLVADMADRMIRVEQRVAASFGDRLTYNQTEYYKSLPKNDRMRLNSYLVKKGRGKTKTLFLLVLSVLAFGLLRVGITANAISDYVGTDVSIWSYVFLGVFVLVLFLIFVKSLANRKKEKRTNKTIKILDDVIGGKKSFGKKQS